jgi:hypothetical protein
MSVELAYPAAAAAKHVEDALGEKTMSGGQICSTSGSGPPMFQSS